MFWFVSETWTLPSLTWSLSFSTPTTHSYSLEMIIREKGGEKAFRGWQTWKDQPPPVWNEHWGKVMSPKISKRLRQSLRIIASQCIWGAITYTYIIDQSDCDSKWLTEGCSTGLCQSNRDFTVTGICQKKMLKT